MRAKDNIWFPFHVNDWMGDTMAFSATQHGIYLMLICEYWNNKGPLKYDEKRLHKITKLSKRTFNIEVPEVLEKFALVDGFLVHKRVDEELAKLAELKEKRSKGGQASAKKRWAKPPAKKDNTCYPSVVTVLPLRASDSVSDCPLRDGTILNKNSVGGLHPNNMPNPDWESDRKAAADLEDF